MPINKRSFVPPCQEELFEEEEAALDTPAKVDASKDQYEASSFAAMGIPKDKVRTVIAHAFYAGGAPLPSTMPTEDLLTLARQSQDPENIPYEQRYRDRIKSPLTAIRAFCVIGHSPSEANRCDNISCPIWPFRMGQNSFYGKV